MRKTSLLAAAVLAFSPLVWSQDAAKDPGSALPPQVVGPPLVVWSEMQKPHPIPQTTLSADSANPTQTAETAPQGQQSATQVFHGQYVLRVPESARYPIESPTRTVAGSMKESQ